MNTPVDDVAIPPRPPSAHIDPEDAQTVPRSLIAMPRWIIWRWRWEPDRRKWDKPPINPMNGRDCDQSDPANWTDFATACYAARRAGDGPGFSLGSKDDHIGFVIVDLDQCREAYGVVAPWAQAIVDRLNSYTEVTPSRKGLRVWLHGKKPGPECSTKRFHGGHVEIYSSGRYLTVSGLHLEGTPTTIETRDDELASLHAEMVAAKSGTGTTKPKGRPRPRPAPARPLAAPHSDEEVLAVARGHRGFLPLYNGETIPADGSTHEFDAQLMSRLAFVAGRGQEEQVKRLWRASPLANRGTPKADREDYAERTVRLAYRGRGDDDYYRWPNGRPSAVGPGKTPSRNGRADPPPIPGPGPDQINLSEWGNARRLIAAHGQELRFCKPMGLWLEWDGTRWKPDQTGAVWRRAKETVRRLAREAASIDDDAQRRALLRWALESEEKKVLAAMIELAWSEPGVAIMPDDLDRNPWLLNTPSGTVCLRTGQLLPHRQADLISKSTSIPFDTAAACPRWEKTLLEIFAGDLAMVAYLQRALGYSLTGVIREHALFLCHGTGRNGKNTVLDTVSSILGDYATVANPRTFLAAGQNDHLAMIADLMGRRFVPTDEVDEGEQLAESMVKRLTGNKTLKARFMHKNPFEFTVLFKVWMLANAKPEVRGQDEGIWSRIRLIPFEVYFPPEKRIKGLGDILLAEEGPGILRWLVDGCLEWQRIGLAEPQKILDAIKAYRSEQDILSDFLAQCTHSHLHNETLREQAKVKAADLYNRYVSWCRDNGERNVLTNRKFGLRLTPLGYRPHDSNSVSYRLGLTLKDHDKTRSEREPAEPPASDPSVG